MKRVFERERSPLLPLGTARQRLEPSSPSAYPWDLLAALRDADVGAETLYLAWQLSAWADDLPAAENRRFLEVTLRSLLAVAAGSSRLPVDANTKALLAKVPALVGTPGDRKPLIVSGEYLYHQRLLACEDRLVEAVRGRAQAPGPFSPEAIERVVRAVVDSGAPRASAEQEAALRSTLKGRFTVVSGGPGTGKTTIVVAIVRALVHLGLPPSGLALAAPTGKAANRLEQAVRAGLTAIAPRRPDDDSLATNCPPAQTLHRLLGYSPSSGTFQHHENNRLAAQAVIVDEGSMIDLFLMERLFRALPEQALLVILGDADQLPSVEAGAVFRDLRALAVRLTHSHRMDPAKPAGRRILSAAEAVRQGDVAALGSLVIERAHPAEVAFEAVELVPAAAREDLLERWYTECVTAGPDFADLVSATYLMGEAGFDPLDQARLERLYAHTQQFRVLCVTRRRAPTGVEAVNAWFHRRQGADSPNLAAGEPIMVLRNDYDRGLWNGDQGLVVRARQEGRPSRLVAAFPSRDRWAAWDLDTLGDLVELSFAMTVHKAQGSEYDQVAVLLPEAHIPLLSRELLYTAFTRSRQSVVVCGSLPVLTAGMANSLVRSSGIESKLAAR